MMPNMEILNTSLDSFDLIVIILNSFTMVIVMFILLRQQSMEKAENVSVV